MGKSKLDKAVAYSYRLLNLRPRSEKELRDRLRRRHFSHTTVFNVISLLKDKGLIDDFEFARSWVESRINTNPKGKRLLWKELREKGISASIIEEVLSSKIQDEALLVRGLAKRKLEKLNGLPECEIRKKLFSFLARRGFDYGMIEDVVNEAFAERR